MFCVTHKILCAWLSYAMFCLSKIVITYKPSTHTHTQAKRAVHRV